MRGGRYFFKDGRIYTGLTVVECASSFSPRSVLLVRKSSYAENLKTALLVRRYLLADEGPGDGGLAVVAGSREPTLSRSPSHPRPPHLRLLLPPSPAARLQPSEDQIVAQLAQTKQISQLRPR